MRKLLSGVLAVLLAVSAAVPALAAKADEVHISTVNGAIYFDDGETVAKNPDGEGVPNPTVYLVLDTLDIDPGDLAAGQFPEDGGGLFAGWSGAGREALLEAFFDKDLFKFKAGRGDDDKKIIESMSIAEKRVTGGADRDRAVKIVIKDDYTDAEYKLSPEFTFTARCDMVYESGGRLVESKNGTAGSSGINGISKGTKYVISASALKNGPGAGTVPGASLEGAIYIGNRTERGGDQDWMAGQGGYVVKPERNEDNTVTWENENHAIAKLEFYADSETKKYYPKLSTRWDDRDYAELFADQDAFIFDFVGNPSISSTIRPTLTLYNPYYDWDEEELTADLENIRIYEVQDGELIDATAAFRHGEDEDGNDVFTLKTRTLGTYIFVEKTLAGEAPAGEPADEKEIPNTGR